MMRKLDDRFVDFVKDHRLGFYYSTLGEMVKAMIVEV